MANIFSQCLEEKARITEACLLIAACVLDRDTFTKKGMKLIFWAFRLLVSIIQRDGSAMVT